MNGWGGPDDVGPELHYNIMHLFAQVLCNSVYLAEAHTVILFQTLPP